MIVLQALENMRSMVALGLQALKFLAALQALENMRSMVALALQVLNLMLRIVHLWVIIIIQRLAVVQHCQQ